MRFGFSKREISDIVVSMLTISVSFAWLVSGGLLDLADFLLALPITFIAIGSGFVLHELAHKFVAIKFGGQAEYRAWPTGLIIALFGALIGFVFAAPGAVYILGPNIRNKENGLISLAGPVTNILIAIVSYLFTIAHSTGLFALNEFVLLVISFTFQANLFLALFNMLPIYPLDGSKVFIWSKAVWAIVFVPLAVIFALGLA